MNTVENLLKGIQISTDIIIEEQNNILAVTIPDEETYEDENISYKKIGEISLTELSVWESKFNEGKYKYADSMLFRENTFEVAIEQQGIVRNLPERSLERYTVSAHEYEFTITKPSTLYMFALFCWLATQTDGKFYISLNRYGMKENINSFEQLCDYFRIKTVNIKTNKKCSIANFKNMLNSYLFNISYLHNISLSVINFSERRYISIKRKRSGQLFPYKNPKIELVKYYHQAVSAKDPFTQYLAYYHVAEFFFQSVSQQDVFQKIEDFITKPSFSPREKESIKAFYDMLVKQTREQREDGVWKEAIGLLLCLKKYVNNIDALKSAIAAIDHNAINYYKNTPVSFTDDGMTINFDDDQEKVYNDIRNRVYSVRNAIVHSKECDKLRYEPFKHDKELAKEIPLIRAISEEIIINSANPTDL